MVVKRSESAHAETVARLAAALERRGLKLFTRIDHAAAAREAGLELAEELVVVFGNPRGGTPLMQADPRVGIELPLRILIWEDDRGALVGYNDPRALADEYDLAKGRDTLEQMATLLAALTDEATGP